MIWKQPIQIVTMNKIRNSFCSHTVGQVKVERGEEVGDGEGMSLEDDAIVWFGGGWSWFVQNSNLWVINGCNLFQSATLVQVILY